MVKNDTKVVVLPYDLISRSCFQSTSTSDTEAHKQKKTPNRLSVERLKNLGPRRRKPEIRIAESTVCGASGGAGRFTVPLVGIRLGVIT